MHPPGRKENLSLSTVLGIKFRLAFSEEFLNIQSLKSLLVKWAQTTSFFVGGL